MFIAGTIAVAGLGLSVVGMAGAGTVASAQADASTALGRAKLKEQNANANVDRFVRTLNNQKKGRALDQNVITAGKNAERAAQAGVRGKVEAQLAEAEGLGAYAAHSAMTPPKMASTPKIQGHGAKTRINWPMDGARMGIVRKTMKVSDITRAMRRPA